MFIRVAADGTVTLEDRGNFRAFKIVAEGGPARIAAVRQALGATADLPDAGSAWVSEKALRSWPGVSRDIQWQAALDSMIEKARPHGWIDDRRRAIKAHVEWTDEA